MPALRLLIDDFPILTVCSDGLDLVDVRVSATKVEPETAAVEVHGGSFGNPGDSRFLFWLEHQALKPRQRVSVEFLSEGESSWPGKTVEELYPDSESECEEPEASLLSRDEVLDQLTLRPKSHEHLSCTVCLPTGTTRVRLEDDEHGYAFGVSWHSHRPERARVSLHSYTIESMRRKENGTYHLQSTLTFGQSACIEVDA